ncbi:MAG: response regulator [Microbacteriaceae bacterium]|jgi:CheY-like chemotaxis protein|nr:response regulator [Microbacteriaceae bacterium]
MSDSDNNGTTRVLIVDDSEDQLLLLRTYFERAGCTVESVGTAEDAINAFDASAPDLAVIDLLLPGMDGWELAARMKERRPECNIVITSVLDEHEYPVDHATLPKPVTGADVRRVLAELVPGWTEK